MEILNLVIIGAFGSALIQVIKQYSKAWGMNSKILTVIVSVLLGAGYYFLHSDAEYWKVTLGILASASTVYAFLVPKKK